MHEAHLMTDLLHKIESIAREDGKSRIAGVEVWLGALCHVSAGHFREHFERETAGTVAEGAELSLVVSDDLRHPRAQDIVLRSVSLES
jgi:hydrogenase nickel incorporation protein HypA/HybF